MLQCPPTQSSNPSLTHSSTPASLTRVAAVEMERIAENLLVSAHSSTNTSIHDQSKSSVDKKNQTQLLAVNDAVLAAGSMMTSEIGCLDTDFVISCLDADCHCNKPRVDINYLLSDENRMIRYMKNLDIAEVRNARNGGRCLRMNIVLCACMSLLCFGAGYCDSTLISWLSRQKHC